MLTEEKIIPLEGEQGRVFAELDAEEQDATKHIKDRRGAAICAILAGKSLLSEVGAGFNIHVDVKSGWIKVTPPPKPEN